MRMKFERLVLKNYRQYREANIDLIPSADNKNLFVIVGESGAGKTNLLNSITWCLYEEEPHLSKGSEQLPMLNLGAVEQASDNDILEVCVEVYFRTHEDIRITFSRSKKFRIKLVGEGKPPETIPMGDSKLKMIKQPPDKDPTILEEPNYDVRGDVERFIPNKIREYFFFDGERIDRYFRETRKVRDPIYRLSRLDLLDKVYEHLDRSLSDFMNEAKLPPEIEETEKKIEELKRGIENLNNVHDKIKEELTKAETNEEEAHSKLRGKEFIKEFIKEEKRLTEEIKRLDQSLEELEKEKIEYLIEIARSIFPLKAVNKSLELIKEKKENKEIPPTIDGNFLRKLIKEEKCICERPLDKGTKERQIIENILNDISVISDVHQELMYTEYELNRLKTELNKFKQKHEKINNQIIELEKKRDTDSRDLKDIQDKLLEHEDIGVVNLEDEYLKWKEIKKDLIGREKVVNMSLTKNKSELEELKKKRDDLLSRQKKYEQLIKIKDFCDKGLDICSRTREEIMADIKNDIESKTKQQFLNLIWRKETYKDVKIDDDYDIHVIHRMGYDGLGTVSAGEREALALAFIGAVHVVSGFEAPIVMDTPLARISGTPRRYIAENLPNYLENEQIILLMTDQEYTSEVRDRLSKRVAKEYELKLGIHEKEVKVI